MTMEKNCSFSLGVRDIACVRGGRLVFSGVSFGLEPGQGLLVTGPNGAGKTSLLRLLAGLSRPASGEIAVQDFELVTPSPQPSPPEREGVIRSRNAQNHSDARESSPTVPSHQRGEGQVGGAKKKTTDDEIPLAERSHFVGHLNAVKAAMTVAENVRFAARYLGSDDTRVPQALDALGIAHLADLPAGILSAGQKRRVGLARLLTVRRLLWLLDEPTVSLDAASAAVLAGMIQAHLAEGGMAVVATHAPLGVELAERLELGAAA